MVKIYLPLVVFATHKNGLLWHEMKKLVMVSVRKLNGLVFNIDKCEKIRESYNLKCIRWK